MFSNTKKLIPLAYNFRIHLERLGYSKNSTIMLPNCLQDFILHISKLLKV